MKSQVLPLLSVLGQLNTRFQTPIFQRVYSWTQRQRTDIWDDIWAAGANETEHFMGSVLIGPDEQPGISDLIDGQQRAVTLSLLLAALRDRLKAEPALQSDEYASSNGEDDANLLDAASIDSHYLMTDGQVKLGISNADAETFQAVVLGNPLPEEDASENIVENERYFADQIASLDKSGLVRLTRGLQKLVVVLAELEPGDQAQLIFETLNSRGMSLSTTDLIRNLLIARFNWEEQARLFEQYWHPVEEAYFDDEERLYEDAAVYAWLKTQDPDITVSARSELYQAVKTYILGIERLNLEELLESLSGFCLRFIEIRETPEAKAAIDWALGRLQGLVSERKLFGD